MRSTASKSEAPIEDKVGGYEAIDVIRAKLTPEEYRGYCKGAMLKYLMRANYKGHHDQDCEKAEWYAKELVKELESKQQIDERPNVHEYMRELRKDPAQ